MGDAARICTLWGGAVEAPSQCPAWIAGKRWRHRRGGQLPRWLVAPLVSDRAGLVSMGAGSVANRRVHWVRSVASWGLSRLGLAMAPIGRVCVLPEACERMTNERMVA